jgi:predicted transposase YbfD/YdcC
VREDEVDEFDARPLITIFSVLPDPRDEASISHKLVDIAAIAGIALCAVVGGADAWTEVEEFGLAKEAWFRSFLELPHGIPSHDTFGRVFSRIDPRAFAACFLEIVEEIRERLTRARAAGDEAEQTIAIDGKVSRATRDAGKKLRALGVVSAWAGATRLVLGQLAVDGKSSETTAIPALLETLDLRGSTVTIDAAGTHGAIAQTIVDRGGEYVLSVKKNQPTTYQIFQYLWASTIVDGVEGAGLSVHECEEAATHGRRESRRVLAWRIAELDWVGRMLRDRWPEAKTAVVIESRRTARSQHSFSVRYFVSSREAEAERIGAIIRGHWAIENSLHWVLDMVFDDDRSRARIGHAAANLALLRRLALNLIRQEQSRKISLRNRRNRAGWDNAYLEKVLDL